MITKMQSRTLKCDLPLMCCSSYPGQQKNTQIAIIPSKMTNHVESWAVCLYKK